MPLPLPCLTKLREEVYNNRIGADVYYTREKGSDPMLGTAGIIIASFVLNVSQPILHSIGFTMPVAVSGQQCCCCKNKACHCGMKKPQAPVSKNSKSSNSKEPCCGNNQPAPQSENSAILSFDPDSLKEILQNALVSPVALVAVAAESSGMKYSIHSSSSPPGFALSIPLRI
jgi:hypothetical protein